MKDKLAYYVTLFSFVFFYSKERNNKFDYIQLAI